MHQVLQSNKLSTFDPGYAEKLFANKWNGSSQAELKRIGENFAYDTFISGKETKII